VRLLEERVTAGVEVRIVGSLSRKSGKLSAQKPPVRLHTRAIVRDRATVFLGSQGLRETELDARREIGVIVRDRKLAARMIKVFESDWTPPKKPIGAPAVEMLHAAKVARKVAKAVAKDLPPVGPALTQALREVGADREAMGLDHEELNSTVQDVVKEAIKQAVRDVVQEAVEHPTVENRENKGASK
jgi:cardiolipin synthase